jgi:hypothetical protein
MILVLGNTTGSTQTYLSGAISVAGGGTTTVSVVAQQLQLATDGILRQNLISGAATVGDSVNTLAAEDAIAYLYQLFQSLGPSTDIVVIGGQGRAQSVTTSAAEALGGASRYPNRKYVSICPTNGIVYWGYSNSVTVSSGTPILKNQMYPISVSDQVPIYIISAGTVDCRITEGG